tara:strand:+ start:1188 stop:1343 length:156 start_codon:yes stop_codon:yes gene_type:complete
MIHTKEEIATKLNGLETYLETQKGRIIETVHLEQVHQFIIELKADLIATKK